MGKGSKPRPLSVDRAKFESEWDRIFSAGTPPPSLTRSIKGEIEEGSHDGQGEGVIPDSDRME